MNKLFISIAAIVGLAIGGGTVHTITNAAHQHAMDALIKQHQQAIASFKCAPTSVVELAPDFDVEKLNNKKGSFSYAPQTKFDNVTIILGCQDSTLLRAMSEHIPEQK